MLASKKDFDDDESSESGSTYGQADFDDDDSSSEDESSSDESSDELAEMQTVGDFYVSSFGRIKRKKGGRHYQKTRSSGYSNTVEIEKGERVQVHALVHVLHNDPKLKKFKPGDTVNHRNHVRNDNDSTNHEWASVPEQSLDQIRTAEGKASCAAKQGLGRIRFVETDNEGKELGAWSGMYPSAHAVERVTGHCNSKVGEWLNDKKHHKHRKSGKYFKYERLPLVVDEDGLNREWRRVPDAWGETPDGFMCSDDGLYRFDDDDEPKIGNRNSGHYQKLIIRGRPVLLHELICWTFHGPPPSPAHTVDHISRKLDADGFLSNHKDNLRWLDASGQLKNRGDVSLADGMGTPVLVTTIAEGTTVTYTDYHSAAAAVGVTKTTIHKWCKESHVVKGKRYELAPQPDLVKTRAKTSVVGGRVKLVLTTEKEEWKPVYREDWLEGGRYFCVRGEKQGPMADRHERKKRSRAERDEI